MLRRSGFRTVSVTRRTRTVCVFNCVVSGINAANDIVANN